MDIRRFMKTAGGACVLIVALVLAVPGEAEVPRRRLDLTVGGAETMQLPHAVKRVTIARPAVADIVVLSPHEIYAFGKKVGSTSVILWGEGTGGRTVVDLVVGLDLTSLKEKLHRLFPDEEIQVYASQTGIVLAGTVSGPEVVEQVLRLARTYLPRAGEQGGAEGAKGTGRSGAGITNLLTVGGLQQVMLEVKFAEVTRDMTRSWQAAVGLENLGSDFRGAVGVGPLGASPSLQNAGTLLLNFADNLSNIFVNIDDFTTALQLLEEEGLARILAEPRLVAQSGQEASFLAGGEFPIPVAQSFDRITVEYKDFGVALKFTPIVLGHGKISLRVAPSVSQLGSSTTVPAGIVGADFVIPSFSTRRLDTTVQLYDGQTLALAGLLQQNLTEKVQKIPGLGDIPILGALFQSSSYQQEKTDLLVAVTPHLVKANKEGALKFPGESMRLPTRAEFYLEERLEGERPDAQVSVFSRHRFGPGSPAKRGGLEGDFGYRTPR